MIVFSFLLVLAALGLLVIGLLGASQVLIWGSIAASAAAGLCLVMAIVAQRRGGRDDLVDIPPGRPDYEADAPTTVISQVDAERASARSGGPRAQSWNEELGHDPGSHDPLSGAAAEHAGQPARHHRGGDSGQAGQAAADGFEDPPDEPVEENVSATDVLRTADLSYDVLVVDGRPRYHLVDCAHLRDREPVSLPLAEARESGFTPCSLCRPDSTLAARTRERYGH